MLAAVMFMFAVGVFTVLAGAIAIGALVAMAKLGGNCSPGANSRAPARTPFFWFVLFCGVIAGVASGIGRSSRAPVPPNFVEAGARLDEFESAFDGKAAPPAPQQGKEPAPVAKVKPRPAVDNKNPSWPISTEYKVSPNLAYDEATSDALDSLVDYLRSQQPPVDWTPPESLVRIALMKTARIEEKPLSGGQDLKKYRCVGTFELTPALRNEILRQDRDVRGQQRMLLLARVLAGLVAFLGAAAVYVRLDEMTKGYYTGWLRLAAVSFLGAAIAVLYLLGPMS